MQGIEGRIKEALVEVGIQVIAAYIEGLSVEELLGEEQEEEYLDVVPNVRLVYMSKVLYSQMKSNANTSQGHFISQPMLKEFWDMNTDA